MPCARAGGVNHFFTVIFTPAAGVHTLHTGHYPMNHTTHMTPTYPLHNPICMGSAREDLPPIGFNTFVTLFLNVVWAS